MDGEDIRDALLSVVLYELAVNQVRGHGPTQQSGERPCRHIHTYDGHKGSWGLEGWGWVQH